jgi:hypothetical protein
MPNLHSGGGDVIVKGKLGCAISVCGFAEYAGRKEMQSPLLLLQTASSASFFVASFGHNIL